MERKVFGLKIPEVWTLAARLPQHLEFQRKKNGKLIPVRPFLFGPRFLGVKVIPSK